MLSKTAMADIKAAQASGVKFTPEDIVRLNALGVRYERGREGADLRIMPRVAFLGDVAFREPTIAHEIWMRDAAHVFDLSKSETLVKVRAFCLATPPKSLPDLGMGLKRLGAVVNRFCRERIGFYTLGQVAAALAFAEDGDDPNAGEIPVPGAKRMRNNSESRIPDSELCYEVGLVRHGVLLRLGSPDDLRSLTVAGLEMFIVNTMKTDSRWGAEYAKDLVNKAFGDYKRTFEAVVAERRRNLKVDAKGVHEADDDAAKCDDQADREAELVKVSGSARADV